MTAGPADWPYRCRWHRRHPAERAPAAGICLLAAALAPPAGAVFLALLGGAATRWAGIPSHALARFFAAPALFLVPGSAGVLLAVAPVPEATVLWSWPDPAWVAVTEGTWERTVALWARVAGMLAWMGFLVFTVPLPAVAGLFRRLRLPDALGELFLASYQFLESLGREARGARTALRVRTGPPPWRQAHRRLAQWLTALFLRALTRARTRQHAARLRGSLMQARGLWAAPRPGATTAGLVGALAVAGAALGVRP